MADAAPTAAAAAAAPAAPSPPKVDKTKVGAKVKAKATIVTDATEAKRWLGAGWQKNVPGIVISVDKRPKPGGSKKQTYITAKYQFPFGHTKVKELHVNVVKGAPEGDGVYDFVAAWDEQDPPPLPGTTVMPTGMRRASTKASATRMLGPAKSPAHAMGLTNMSGMSTLLMPILFLIFKTA